MTGNDQRSKSKDKNPDKNVPDWMDGKFDDGFTKYLATVEPTIVIEHTRYCEEFPYEPRNDGTDKDYLHILISSAFVLDANDLCEWRNSLSTYPSKRLSETQIGTAQNPDVQARAHYLRHAMTRLLQLVNAPEIIMHDLQAILDCHKPRSADVCAQAQEELCKSPNLSARAIARNLPKRTTASGEQKVRDHSEISSHLKTGRLVRPGR